MHRRCLVGLGGSRLAGGRALLLIGVEVLRYTRPLRGCPVWFAWCPHLLVVALPAEVPHVRLEIRSYLAGEMLAGQGALGGVDRHGALAEVPVVSRVE